MIEPKHKSTRPTALKIFVDRENFQEAFFQALNRKPDEKFKVLVYYGVGGIGKTELRKELTRKLKEQRPKAIIASLNLHDPHFRQQDNILAGLRESLKNQYKIQFPTYEIAYTFYWRKVQPDSVKTVREIPFMEDGSIMADIISFFKDVPVVGVVPKIAKIVLKGTSTLKTWWTTRGEATLKQLEYMEPNEIQEKLPMFWAEDFSDYLKQNNNPAVFFIDTYEALWEMNRSTGHYVERDAWVRELVAQLPLPANVLWVICGREHLRWKEVDPDWENYMDQHLVGNLADSDAKHLLQMRGIKDSDLQEAIVRASAGVPFYLDLAIESSERISNNNQQKPLPANFSGTHNDILERFLRYLDRSEKTALEVLSAARFWNRKIFDLLLTNFDTGFPREKFSELMRFSFINEEDSESDELKYTMHQLMRKNLQELQNKKDCHKRHNFLFEHYSKLLPMEGTIGITGDHKVALNEAFYHGQIFMEAADFNKWFFEAEKPFNGQAQFGLLMPLYSELLVFTEEVLGQNHPDFVAIMNGLAALYIALGKYNEAEPLAIRALTISEKDQGKNNEDVVMSLFNMSLLYLMKGKYNEAEPLVLRALTISEKDLSQIDPYSVALSLNILVLQYLMKGKYDEAEPLVRRALTIIEECRGPNHPDVTFALNNQTMLYIVKEKYDEAEPLVRRALKIIEENLGQNHPDVAGPLINQATIYIAQRKYTEAEPLVLRALKISEDGLGKNHPTCAFVLNLLAIRYHAKGKYDEAETIALHALKISEAVFGSNNVNVAAALDLLAFIYRTKRKYNEAEPLLRRALTIIEECRGPNHPDVTHYLLNLARLYSAKKKDADAKPLLLRALKIGENVLGKNDPVVATSLNDLAVLYHDQKKYDEAEPLYIRALKIREEVLGENGPDVAIVLNNLGVLYRAQGKYADAKPLLLRALKIREEVLGKNDPVVAASLNSLARLYRDQGKYEEAESLALCALKIREEVLGENDPVVAASLNNLALIYQAQGVYDEAEFLLLRALKIREKVLGENHPDVAESLNDLAMLYREQKRCDEAEPLYIRALKIREEGLGQNHPDVAESRKNLAGLYETQRKEGK